MPSKKCLKNCGRAKMKILDSQLELPKPSPPTRSTSRQNLLPLRLRLGAPPYPPAPSHYVTSDSLRLGAPPNLATLTPTNSLYFTTCCSTCRPLYSICSEDFVLLVMPLYCTSLLKPAWIEGRTGYFFLSHYCRLNSGDVF